MDNIQTIADSQGNVTKTITPQSEVVTYTPQQIQYQIDSLDQIIADTQAQKEPWLALKAISDQALASVQVDNPTP